MASRGGKSDSMFSDTQKGLAWFICGSFVLLIFSWVFWPPTMSPESMGQLNNLVSTLVNIVLLSIGYFFGSSRSSRDKDETQAKVAEKLAEKVTGISSEPAPETTITTVPSEPSTTPTTTTVTTQEPKP